MKKLIRLEAAKTYRLLELNFYIPIYSISWVPLTPKRMYHQAAEAIGCLVKLSERDNAVSQIYAGQDCLAPFMDDFRNAAIDILFVCPFLNKPRLKAILPILEKEIARGTLITICTRIPESYQPEQREVIGELIAQLEKNRPNVRPGKIFYAVMRQ